LLSAVLQPGSGGGRSAGIGLPRSPIDSAPDVWPLHAVARAQPRNAKLMPALREIAAARFVACHYPIEEVATVLEPPAAIA
jgi:hypothetical protein